ncbi:hypothetical protein [Bdellovibrio bacteriovorus]|nr:hypothetical protein [Bdellovibrio bacteriovorus]
MKKSYSVLLLCVFLGIQTGVLGKVWAKSLSGTELFAKCYMQFTGLPLPLQHPWKLQIMAGTLRGEQACVDLLDKAELNSQGMVSSDSESKAVLNRIYEFHRSWFEVGVFNQMQNFAGGDVGHYGVAGTSDVLDSTEPALAITYNLFSSSLPHYSQVLRTSSGFVAQREVDPTINPSFTGNNQPYQLLFRSATNWNATTFSGSFPLAFPRIQKGELTGIKPQTQNIMVPDYWIDPPLSQASDTNLRARRASLNTPGTPSEGSISSFNFFDSMGGGLLGFQSTMLLNWGHEDALLANGSLKLPRRWIKNMLNTMLCKELPVLREADVVAFVDSSGGPDVAPFREGTSCLQCHGTLDQLAMVGRNFTVARTEPGNGQRVSGGGRKSAAEPNGITSRNSYVMGRYSVISDPGYSWSSTPVANFHRSQPRGKVYLRTFSGALVNQPVNGLAEAGAALSNIDDFYQCAAKRYFEYLTGNEVLLYDRGDSRFANVTKSLSTEAIRNRLFIEKLSRELKATGSLRSLIKSILQSEYYTESK